ncbi:MULTISPECIES: hypothetical protein [Lactobacillales]|uniref:Uncharacterized protein n=1 Tax=Ligilactobacillus salivarius TaxID=1624 RepID=A0A1V9RBN9_9LACO|nr:MULTISPECIES: hypothetical protein [Lactobacillales]PEH09948.1 hypothetical protein CP353_05910 [Lactobacillus sp. UMNPBX2]AYC11610.1 hypothetical protein LS1_01658 [Ligilactobacillus salivarius]MBE5066741.1 hypothetical protein [Ligilactobacillus salivarius]MBZ4031105.1 hypothetical protein [Ligilactobacillus salivarius]MDM8284418.1 hypothetical protein [Ligilactobacillus salivarius]
MTDKLRRIVNGICWYIIILMTVFILLSLLSLYINWSWNLALGTWFIFLIELILFRQTYRIWRELDQ